MPTLRQSRRDRWYRRLLLLTQRRTARTRRRRLKAL